MAPAKSPASAKRRFSEDDDALLDSENNGSFFDSVMIVCAAKRLVDQVLQLCGAQATASPVRKKVDREKEAVPFKEAAAQWLSDFKIPLGLLAIFVLTCAIIAGGEGFSSTDERKREVVDDYYGTLGVVRDADTADIKRAYKTLAKRWHPDKNPNCTSCQETFSKIAIAYETLVDDEKRAAYDESGDVDKTDLKSPRSVPLTRDNFDELVTFSNDVWIVQIYKPDDAGCAQFHPFWENQIQKYGHLVRFGRVDATNDTAKWLGVKPRLLPMVLKFGRHLGAAPEIFPITAMHETPQQLMKFVLTSFPNVGLRMDQDAQGLVRWLSGASRKHRVLFALPGKSEEERYKSHLVSRMLASRWSEIFEFRTAETSVLHRLPQDAVPAGIKAALPAASNATSKAGILFFSAVGGTSPKASAVIPWPSDEDALVLQLLDLAELATPALSARSAELLCRSLAVRRVYCLALVDTSDAFAAKAVRELRESRAQYEEEVADIRASGGEITDEEDNFVVHAVRLFRDARGLQPSLSTCRAPRFAALQEETGGADAFLMDIDTGRAAALKQFTSFRGIYPQIAYEDNLKWSENALRDPFLVLPDCDESLTQHFLRSMRAMPLWEFAVQAVTLLLLAEASAKAASEWSLRWATGASVLLFLLLLRSPPFLRGAAAYLPGGFFAPPFLLS